jgi:hypothetical protein
VEPTNTIPILMTIQGPTHWERGRRPIFKIRKILLGLLHAAQHVCPEARLSSVHKDNSIEDILQMSDIPDTSKGEKDFIFDPQIQNQKFQGQILLKTNKKLRDFLKDNEFHDWLVTERIRLDRQAHTGVHYIKIGFFSDMVTRIDMESFHTQTLRQWLAPSKIGLNL